MLAHQRRRWQLGLCQTLWKHSQIMFDRRYGIVGWLSFPFHSYVEGLGAAVEFLGYLLIPLGLYLRMIPPGLLIVFIRHPREHWIPPVGSLLPLSGSR
jgi:cellulose synthase/poly-beta-1,6-N-acetylglucosamine synthase-like glycosyltransferase